VDNACHPEDRLEADSLLTYETFLPGGLCFGAMADTTHSLYVFFCEAIFIGMRTYFMAIVFQGESWSFTIFISVVVGILDELKQKVSRSAIQLYGEAKDRC
jgi:hypothetical protein